MIQAAAVPLLSELSARQPCVWVAERGHGEREEEEEEAVVAVWGLTFAESLSSQRWRAD